MRPPLVLVGGPAGDGFPGLIETIRAGTLRYRNASGGPNYLTTDILPDVGLDPWRGRSRSEHEKDTEEGTVLRDIVDEPTRLVVDREVAIATSKAPMLSSLPERSDGSAVL